MEKVLVCLLASTRAHKLSFRSFKRQVLEELGGDLALALVVDRSYDYANPYWRHAKYRWTAPNFQDYGEAFDLAQRWLCQRRNITAPNWRSMLKIKGIWQGGIRSTDPQLSASSILPFCRWLLLSNLQQDDILNRYDRFVITRSDFVWLGPHPPLSVLDRSAIWVPSGEDYGGLNDRHMVASRADVVSCLNMIEDILLRPDELYEEMKHRLYWNDEQFLAHHFARKGILQKVKRFPYVMYTARPVFDVNPTWSRGRYEPAVGHFVKYEKEFRDASNYVTMIRCRSDWENGAWRLFDSTKTASRPASLARRILYSGERAFFETLSVLWQPGRVERLVKVCSRMLRLTVPGLLRR